MLFCPVCLDPVSGPEVGPGHPSCPCGSLLLLLGRPPGRGPRPFRERTFSRMVFHLGPSVGTRLVPHLGEGLLPVVSDGTGLCREAVPEGREPERLEDPLREAAFARVLSS